MDSTPARRLPIGETYNLRDVGGYPVTGGGTTVWGQLFRSDYPKMNVAGRPELARLGLRTVVDLRAPSERAARPSEVEGLVDRAISRPFSVGELMADDPSLGESLSALYTAAVQQLGPQIAEVVSVLGEPDALPALVHCAAGKDRTGIVIGLILSAIGVPDATVAADYALTADYLTPEFFAAADPAAFPAGHIDITPLHRAQPAAMLDMLTTTRSLASDAASYLTGRGVAPQNLERLRTALVDTGSNR
jgi:protein-tyrosine phosphatase